MADKSNTTKNPPRVEILEAGADVAPGVFYTGTATRVKAGVPLPKALRGDSARVLRMPGGNPKAEGCASARRFDLYMEGPEVETRASLINRGITPKDLDWDFQRGFIATAAAGGKE